jgi:hypothetical protein
MISKNVKRGRGRPGKFSDESLQQLGWKDMETLTNRQKQNRHYTARALWALARDPEAGDLSIRPDFKWLYDETLKGKSRRYGKATILAQLGRIGNDQLIKKVARELCKLEPRTKDAVVLIRQLRSGGVKEGDTKQLTQEIAKTILQYRIRYPKTSQPQVNDALASNLKPLKEN